MSTTGRKRQNDCPDGSRDAKLPKLDVSTVDWPAFFKDAANQASVNRFFDEPKDSKKYYALRVVRVRDRDLERKIELKAISTEVVAGQKRHLSIYVYFDAACLASLRERDITIKPQDEIYLSLKDARRAKFESDDSPVLQYHTNVIYQYRSCADQRLCGKVVNTADWFNKFASSQSLESDDMDVDEVADDRTTLAPAAPSHEESLSARTPTRSNTTKSMPTPPNTVCGSSPVNAPSVLRAEPEPEPVASEQLEHAPQRDSKQGTAGSKAKSKQKKPKPAPPAEEPHEGVEKLSKGQKKKRQEKRKKQRIAAESPNQGSAPATAEPSPKPVTVATPTIQPVQSVSAGPATPTPAPPATPATWPPPGGQIIQLTAPGEEEGSTVLTTGRGERYIALNTVENKPAGELWSVIGIVEFAKDVKQTKMGGESSH
ncbi:uncharacterized protein SCHCODRAFT_02485678 [Schizophyllum commune H4-8]|nr:uncharacterized protein SCHCODRAFT_02485678 [Schizophyllum commune H4-8]KAI5900430.1 hypothetical protein SCHCODRAFT_02485678 [Schizophyllum commune H4-8]